MGNGIGEGLGLGFGEVEVESMGEGESVGEMRERGDDVEGRWETREIGREERTCVGREITDEVKSERDWDWGEGEREGARVEIGERFFYGGWERGEGVLCGLGIDARLVC